MDVLWGGAPTTEVELETIAKRLEGTTTLLDWLENGKTPTIAIEKIKSFGFGVVIFPIGSVLAVEASLREHYASLRKVGTTSATGRG